jgi:hypothetical protein
VDDLQIMLTVEGEHREPFKTSNCMIGFTDQKKLQVAIRAIEDLKGKPSRGQPDKPHVILGIGGKDFCQAFVHFWATGRNGGSTWGYHLLRRLSRATDGEVVWVNTATNEFVEAEIFDMFAHAAKMATASQERRS